MSQHHATTLDLAGTEVNAEIEYTFTPGYPATGPSYASGGPEVDIVRVTFAIGDERHEAPAWLVTILANDDNLRDELCEAGESDGPDLDEAYERKRDNEADMRNWSDE